MPSYQENYIYSVQVTGAAQAIAQLRELQQAANGVRGGTGTLGVSQGSASAGGAAAGEEWGRSFGSTVQRAMANVLVYGAIGAGIGAIIGGVNEWKTANIELSDSLAELQVKLGATRAEAEAYYWTMQQAAFVTGQDVQESIYAKTIEQRTNRPGLAVGGMEFGMVFPEVPVQQAVGNLLALQIQFGTSFGEINEVLLDTIQASGLTAKELLNLSDTWGPLSQELGMLDAAGNRTTEGMRNISGLMAGMATVMGESGSTIENFLRKMSQFYTNDDLKAFLSLRGIETTTGKTAAGLDIRVPFMDLMAQISAQAKAESGFAVGLQEFFPNQLGQPTQQQLQELIRNWDTISGIMTKSVDPVKEWGNAVEASSERASIAIERLGTAFSGLFAALGGNKEFVDLLNRIAADVQNAAIRSAGTTSGDDKFTKGSAALDLGLLPWKSALDDMMQAIVRKGGGNPDLYSQILGVPIKVDQNRYFSDIFATTQLPDKWNPAQTMQFFENALPKFTQSETFDPEDSKQQITQAFIEWMSDLGPEMADRLAGVLDTAAMSFDAVNDSSTRASTAVSLLEYPSNWAASAILGMAGAAESAIGILSGAMVTLPEGVTPEQAAQGYASRIAGIGQFAADQGVSPAFKFEPTTIFNSDGLPVSIVNVVPSILQDSVQAADKTNKTIEAENKRGIAAAEAAANKANAAAEARAKRLEGLFDSMFAEITKPTSVTASDLMYNSPGGTYQDKWDEPVRQMRADVNNLINGKPNEYGFGGGAFSSIFEPGILGFAQGADQETKAAIMRDLQSQAEKAYYSFTLPQDAYAGGKDALIASAQEWVAGKKNEKANKSMMKGWLTEAGLGPEAMGFLDEMDEPPIVKMLTGGKTKDEMTTIFEDKIPNVSDSLAKGAKDVAWITIIGTTITAQAKENPDPLIGAGQAMGGWIAQGSASAFVAALVPQIIAAVLAGL